MDLVGGLGRGVVSLVLGTGRELGFLAVVWFGVWEFGCSKLTYPWGLGA